MKNQTVAVITTKEENITFKIISPKHITSIIRYASDSQGFTPFKYLAILYSLERVNEHIKRDKIAGLAKITFEGQSLDTEAFCLPYDFILERCKELSLEAISNE